MPSITWRAPYQEIEVLSYILADKSEPHILIFFKSAGEFWVIFGPLMVEG